MRNELKIAVGVLGIVILGIGFWWFLTSREPRYQGKPLHIWLADFDLSGSRQPEAAAEALRNMGTNAVPLLTQLIQSKDPQWKQVVMGFNDRQRYLQFQVTEARVLRFRAVEAYRVLGPVGATSVSNLIKIMSSEASAEVRADVATALGWIGPEAKEAIPVLLKAAEDPHPQLRRNALFALANIRRFESGGGSFRF